MTSLTEMFLKNQKQERRIETNQKKYPIVDVIKKKRKFQRTEKTIYPTDFIFDAQNNNDIQIKNKKNIEKSITSLSSILNSKEVKWETVGRVFILNYMIENDITINALCKCLKTTNFYGVKSFLSGSTTPKAKHIISMEKLYRVPLNSWAIINSYSDKRIILSWAKKEQKKHDTEGRKIFISCIAEKQISTDNLMNILEVKDKDTISDWCTGANLPSGKNTRKIKEVFHIDADKWIPKNEDKIDSNENHKGEDKIEDYIYKKENFDAAKKSIKEILKCENKKEHRNFVNNTLYIERVENQCDKCILRKYNIDNCEKLFNIISGINCHEKNSLRITEQYKKIKSIYDVKEGDTVYKLLDDDNLEYEVRQIFKIDDGSFKNKGILKGICHPDAIVQAEDFIDDLTQYLIKQKVE